LPLNDLLLKLPLSLFLQTHWPIPQQVAPGLPLQRFLFSRLPSLLLPPYYTAPASQQHLARIGAPLRDSLWRWLQRSVMQLLGLQGELLPRLSLQQDLLYYGQVADAEWSSIVLQQQQQGGKAAAAAAVPAASGGVVGASGSTAVLSSMQQRQLRTSAVAASTAGSGVQTGTDHSACNMQQQQGAGSSSSSRSRGSLHKGLLRGFLHRRSTAASLACSSISSIACSGTPANENRSGNSNSSSSEERLSRENSSSCNSGNACGGSGNSSGSSSGCTVVPLFGEVERLGRDCLLLRSGGAVGADVVLYCTGYSRSYEFLDEALRVSAQPPIAVQL
jgi:hypothetical protein